MSALSHNLHRACAHTLKTAALRQSATTTSSLITRSSSSPRLPAAVAAPFTTTAVARGTEWARPLRCLRCDQPGHRVKDCPNPKRCYNCGQEGHDARSCTHPVMCHRCGEDGHIALNCPSKATIPKCTYCGDKHPADQCPHAKDEARIRGAA